MAGYSKNKKVADREHAEDYIASTGTDEDRIRAGHDFYDSKGNYWGHCFNNEGKRVRICIPNRD